MSLDYACRLFQCASEIISRKTTFMQRSYKLHLRGDGATQANPSEPNFRRRRVSYLSADVRIFELGAKRWSRRCDKPYMTPPKLAALVSAHGYVTRSHCLFTVPSM